MALQNIEANVTLDLYQHDTTPSTVKAIQLDSQTRYVAAMLQNGGVQYDVDSEAEVQLIIVRPDKVGVQITGTTFTYGDEGAQFLGPYAELTQVALAVNGKMRGQFKITSGTQILRTEIFAISNGEALDASTDEWADEYDGYNLEEMADAIDSIRTATASDIGKYLRAAAVENGKVTGWQFSTPSGGGGGGGQDGFSPIMAVTDITGGHRVSITDVDGTQSFDVMDGSDGFSPNVTVTNITGGHRVSITDATGTKTFDVMDGTSSGGGSSSGSESSSALSGKKVLFFGDSISYGEGNNGHSFIDIIDEMGICDSLVKEAHTSSCIGPYQVYQDGAGYDLVAMIELQSTAVTNADIIFCGYGGNDTHAVSVGNVQLGHYTDAATATTVCGYMRKAINRIRTLNPDVRLCWLFPQLRDFVIARGGSVADNDYFVTVTKALSDVCEDLNVPFMGLYTGLNMEVVTGGHLINDTAKHPTEAGHELIAENVLYGYPFDVKPYVPKRVVTLESDGTYDCTFAKLLLMVSHDIDVTIDYDGNLFRCCSYSSTVLLFKSETATSTTSKTEYTLAITASATALYTSVTAITEQPWGGGGSSGTTVIYNGNATVVSGSPNYVSISTNETINDGETWKVTWNGTEYTYTPVYSSQITGYYIGNPGVVGGTDDGSGATFWGYKRTSSQLAFSTTDSAGTITLKIEKITS